MQAQLSKTNLCCIYSLIASLFVFQIFISVYFKASIGKIEAQCLDVRLRYRRSTSNTESNLVVDGVKVDTPLVELQSVQVSQVHLIKFCKNMTSYCQAFAIPGSPGLPGNKGMKGDTGGRGLSGEPGPKGPIGPRGLPGPRGRPGEKGQTGSPGLDGIDGLPGEPGLDGLPGRHGFDGKDGFKGEAGIDGIPGTPGYNGTDGTPGAMGESGPQGPRGPPGISGLKGPAGKPGRNGINGVPAVCVHQVETRHTNGTNSSHLLIAPSIIGNDIHTKTKILNENDNVRMRCATTGAPSPKILWKRINGTIPQGRYKVDSVEGPVLTITHINRTHMGEYICIAENGIPPAARQLFYLDVQFSPLIRIYRPVERVMNGSTARLECEVEASPEAVKYWLKDKEILLELSTKYRIGIVETAIPYKFKMHLNITRINSSDIGEYQCVAKNEKGITVGDLRIQYEDPEFKNPDVQIGKEVVPTIHGVLPPTEDADSDLCLPKTDCPKCPDTKPYLCQEGIYSLYELIGHRDTKKVAQQLLPNISNKDLPRNLACELKKIGKPVYHYYTNEPYVCWMQVMDNETNIDNGNDTLWVTSDKNRHELRKYMDKESFRRGIYTNYSLDLPFTGSSHVVYNKRFYYNQRDSANLISYSLRTQKIQKQEIPFLNITNRNLLYTTKHDFVDVAVDENGLWLIYGLEEDNNTAVVKLEPNTLQIEMAWNISLKHKKVGELFIVCGVLYAVDDVTNRTTNIRFGFDLYEGKLLEDVNLQFSNPFSNTSMIGYNPRSKELYTWDTGNRLTYPIRYKIRTYAKEEPGVTENTVQNKTEVEIFHSSETL